MLKRIIRNINNRLDETSPKVYSHQDWDHNNYNFDSEHFNYDNFEVAPLEDEQSAYLSMCALANYSAGAVSSLGNLDAGSVQNVNLAGVNQHKACLSSIGSTMESTLQNMGNALNVRYTAEMENQGLFGGEPGQLLDIAGYLREVAAENTSDILDQIAGFGQQTGEQGGYQPQYDESVFTDPAKLSSTYQEISGRDPSTWSEEDKYVIMAYYNDLAGRTADAKAKADEAALYSYDTFIWDDYDTLKAEQNRMEKMLKANGMMEYSDWEKGWQDIKAAGKALVSEGSDVIGAIKDGDWKGAWHEFTEFNEQLLATGAVVTESTVSGVLKIGEYINDGAHILLTTAATPTTYLIDKVAGTDLTGKMWDATMDDVARDKVGEAREWFYEGTPIGQYINEQSTLKWDSDGSKALLKVGTKAGEIVIAAGVTVATGGAGAPLVAAGLGFLEGTGEEAERRFNLTDENGNYTNRSAKDVALSYLKGVGKGAEWYMYGDVANNLLNKGVQAAAEGVFTGNNAKDALINMAKKADVYVDVASSLANATSTRLTTGKWNWGEFGLDLGLSLLGNYGGEYLTAVSNNRALREAAMNETGETFFDSIFGRNKGPGPTPKIPTPKLAKPVVGPTPPITYFSQGLDPSQRQLAEGVDNFYQQTIMDGYHREFDGFLSPDQIEGVRYANSYETDFDFQNFRGSDGQIHHMNGSGGFNEGYNGRSHINMDLPGYAPPDVYERNRILLANTSHENIHGLARGSNGQYGIKQYVPNPATGGWIPKNTGLNEAMTEYLNERVAKAGGYYPNQLYCGYQPAINEMRPLIDTGIITPNEIKQMYLVDHSPQALVDKIDNLLGPGHGRSFVDLFDYATSGSSAQRQQGLDAINQYVAELIRRTP